jgi:TP901 family phage tail tape measure protein
MTLARLFVLLSLDSGPFKAGMMSAITQVNMLQNNLRGLQNANLMSAGRSLTYGLTVPIIAAAAAIGIFGSKLDSELARVQSVIATPTDSGLAQIQQWRDGIQDLAITLGRSSPEVAGGMYEIVSALGNIPNAMEYLTAAGRAAVAGQSDIVTSTKNLVLATRAWGDSSTDAVRTMANLMSATVRVGTVTESELGPAMANLLPIGRLYNVQLESLFSGIASLAGVSGSAAQASTQLQRAIISITSPNTTLAAAYKKLGIASGEALLEQRGLIGSFQAIKDISEQLDIPLNKLLGRIEGVKAIATLTGPQIQAFDDNLTAIKDSTWAVDAAFEGTTNGINRSAFQWAQAGQRLRVIAEDLYQSFAPASLKVLDALEPIIGMLRRLADTIAGMRTENVTLLLYALLGLTALGPVLTMIGSLISTFRALWFVLSLVGSGFGLLNRLLIPVSVRLLVLGGTLSGFLSTLASGFMTAITGVMVAIAGLSLPILLLIVAVAALATAWYFNWGGIRERTAAATEAIKGHFDGIKSAWGTLVDSFTSKPLLPAGQYAPERWAALKGLLSELGATARDAVNAFAGFDLVGQTFSATSALISGTLAQWQSMFNNAKASISNFFTSGQAAALSFGLSLVAAFASAQASVSQTLSSIANTIRTGLIGAFNAALASVRSFGAGMASAFSSAVAAARSAVASIRAAFQINWSSIGYSIASGIAGGIRAGVGAITSAAVSAAQSALSAAKGALGIRSPSSVMRKEVGFQIPAGLALGIYDGAKWVTRAMVSLWSTMQVDPYTIATSVTGSMTAPGYPLAGAGGGGGVTINIENTFNGPVDQATVAQVKEANTTSIIDALRRRGLAI